MTNSVPTSVSSEALASLFSDAHTQRTFVDEPVTIDDIRRVYDDVRWAPTAFNANALRLAVVNSDEARATLVKRMAAGNQPYVDAAPTVVVACWDENFGEGMLTMGTGPELVDMVSGNHQMARDAAMLQAGYTILALRAHGFHVGPMTGADFDGIDADLFADSSWHPFMVMVVGRTPTPEGTRPRQGRLESDVAVRDL